MGVRSHPCTVMPQTFMFILRASKEEPFEVPSGYHRIQFKEDGEDDDFCAWEGFCFGYGMQDSKISTAMGDGLAAPVALGPGEWRVCEGEVPPGWKVVEVSEANFGSFMPRLGYLLQDQNLDSDKFDDGRQKFILKESTEGTNKPQPPRTKYSKISIQMALGDGWTGSGDGMEEVDLTEQMMMDLEIEPKLIQAIKDKKQRIVGKV